MYIGRRRPLESGIPTVDEFTGDGTTTAFTMSRSVSHERQVLVMQGGAVQDYDNFSVSGATLTFTTAPADQVYIQVIHFLGVQSYFQLLDNSIGITQLTGISPLVQHVSTRLTNLVSCTTVFPNDDTTPSNTEGDLIFTQAITPQNANNRLRINVYCWGEQDTGSSGPCVSLLKDGTCVAAMVLGFRGVNSTGVGNARMTGTLYHEEDAGGTSAQSWTVRCGPESTGTFNFGGGGSGNERFNNLNSTWITIDEYSEAL